MRLLLWSLLLLPVFFLTTAVAQTAPGDELQARAREAWEQKRYPEAIAAWRSLRDQHPQHASVVSGEAQFWLWCALGGAEQYREEVVELQAFLQNYPGHGSREYAMYFLGQTLQRVGDATQARATWEKQLQEFPNGDMAEYARQALSGDAGIGGAHSANAPVAPPITDFRSGAEAAARWLRRVAEPCGEHGLHWAEYAGTKAHPTGLYSGSAGVALFAVNLFRVTGKTEWRELASQAAAGLLARSRRTEHGLRWEDEWETDDGTVLPRDPSVAFYVGSAGIGSVFLTLHEVLGTPEYLATARAAADDIVAGKDPWGEDTDIISGAAGIGLFLLELHRVTGEPAYLKGVQAAADALRKVAVEDGAGRKWKSSASLDRFYTGFSHGTAGIAAFFARAYERTRNARDLECAEAGARWLLATAVRDGDGCKWFHYAPDHADQFQSGWCHGPSGTARLFLELHRITGKVEYRTAAEQGAAWILQTLDPRRPETVFYGQSMCCGATGIGDFFLDLFLATGDDRYFAYAAGVGRHLLSHGKRDGDGLCWTNYDQPDESGKIFYATGHMLGAAGAGTFLLRLDATARGREDRVLPTADKPRWPASRSAAAAPIFVVTDLPESDPYFAAARRLAEFRKGTIVRADWAELAPLQRRLALGGARFVACVMRPEALDVNLHRRLLTTLAALDEDPFVDAALGYITGPTPESAMHLVESAHAMEHKGLPKTAVHASVVSQSVSYVSEDPGSPLLRDLGWTGKTIYWSCIEDDPKVLEFVRAQLPELAHRGLVMLGGNGDPEGIWLFHDDRNCDASRHWPFDPARVGEDPKGEMPRIKADAFRALDLSSAVVWSGTCHSGVLTREYVEGDIVSTFGTVDRITRYDVPRERSLGMSILGAGASAFLAPIGSNHGFATLVESWRALSTGMSLGEVMRTRYNEIVLAERGPLAAPLYVHGEPELTEDPMRGGGVNRLLYGDPLYRPFADAGRSAVKMEFQPKSAGAATVTLTVVDENSGLSWDMFGNDRENPERVYGVIDLPAASKAIVGVTAAGKSPDGKALPLSGTITWAMEDIDGKRRLHLQANGPRDALSAKGTVVAFTLEFGK